MSPQVVVVHKFGTVYKYTNGAMDVYSKFILMLTCIVHKHALEVGSIRCTMQGSRKIGIVDCVMLAPKVVEFAGEVKAQLYDTFIQYLEMCTPDAAAELTDKGVIAWALVSAGDIVYVPQGHMVVDFTVGSSCAHGVKFAVLLRNVALPGMQKIHDLYAANSRQTCASQVTQLMKVAQHGSEAGDPAAGGAGAADSHAVSNAVVAPSAEAPAAERQLPDDVD